MSTSKREPKELNLIYLANVRMPTEKAHGIAIMRSCAAFAASGATVELVVASRRNSIGEDPFVYYGIDRIFPIRKIPVFDFEPWIRGGLWFIIESISFYIASALWLAVQSRSKIIYTRDPVAIIFSLIGFRVVYECHTIPNSMLFRILLRRAFRVIPISHALADTLARLGYERSNMLVAPSGVDLKTFDIDLAQGEARKQLHLPLTGSIAVYTGNFTTMGVDKGIADIIKSLTFARGISFVAVGGSVIDIERYEKIAEESGVRSRVTLRGHATQSVLATYQKAADVLLMPFPDTHHYRSHMSPVKMFEYMAARRPIIASNLPTIREVLNDENSLLIPPGDDKALASGMEMLVADPDRAMAIADRAYREVQEYSWAARTKRILSLLA